MRICKYFLCLVIAIFLASSRVVLSEDYEAEDENDNPEEEINDYNDEPEEFHSDDSLQKDSDSSNLDVETLLETLRNAEIFLQEIAPKVNLDSTLEQVEELIEKSHRLEALHAQVQEKRQAVDELIRITNTRQLEHLLQRLNGTLERELTLRNTQDQREHGAVTTEQDFEPVSMNDLKRAFETKSLMKESEAMLQEWVIGIIEEELAAFEESHVSLEGKVECATRLKVVHDVQAALTKHSQDGIGMVDYAQGATIVHEMTSASYIPPPTEDELLGNVWWGKYIPEDWEQLLPQGWQEWNVGIPSFVYHALGIRGAKTAAPNIVLQSNLLPGSCWPMDGASGRVTLRLAYPVALDAVSVDHVSAMLVPAEARTSAPKKIRVIGYPPCDNESDEQCAALGFDVRDSIHITELEYAIEGPTIQTFKLVADGGSHLADFEDEEEKEEGDEEADSGMCAESSCSAPPQSHTIAGITFEVLENWGNQDFTCLYRLRVHGDIEQR